MLVLKYKLIYPDNDLIIFYCSFWYKYIIYKKAQLESTLKDAKGSDHISNSFFPRYMIPGQCAKQVKDILLKYDFFQEKLTF